MTIFDEFQRRAGVLEQTVRLKHLRIGELEAEVKALKSLLNSGTATVTKFKQNQVVKVEGKLRRIEAVHPHLVADYVVMIANKPHIVKEKQITALSQEELGITS